MRQRYLQLKDLNEHLLRNLENGQQELDQLNTKIESLQEVSARSFLSICSWSPYAEAWAVRYFTYEETQCGCRRNIFLKHWHWKCISSVPWPSELLGGHEGWLSRNRPPVFSAGGHREQFWHSQGHKCTYTYTHMHGHTHSQTHTTTTISIAYSSVLETESWSGIKCEKDRNSWAQHTKEFFCLCLFAIHTALGNSQFLMMTNKAAHLVDCEHCRRVKRHCSFLFVANVCSSGLDIL